MGTCDPIRDNLARYLSDDLSGSEREALDGHLRGCSSCQVELQSLRMSTDLFREAVAEQISESDDRFAAEVLLQLPASKQPKKSTQRKGFRFPEFRLMGTWVCCNPGSSRRDDSLESGSH